MASSIPQPIHLIGILSRQAKSIMYENRYTRLTYEFEMEMIMENLPGGTIDDETEMNVSWMNFQHFLVDVTHWYPF